MRADETEFSMGRRGFLAGAAASAGLLSGGQAAAQDWAPADIRYGYSSIAWGADAEETDL